jgi:hypothetical protein
MVSAFGVRPQLGKRAVQRRDGPQEQGAVAADNKEWMAKEAPRRAAAEL